MAEISEKANLPMAGLIVEMIGKEIICANKEKWDAALQTKLDSIPQINITKHFLWKEIKVMFEDVCALCDCPVEDGK